MANPSFGLEANFQYYYVIYCNTESYNMSHYDLTFTEKKCVRIFAFTISEILSLDKVTHAGTGSTLYEDYVNARFEYLVWKIGKGFNVHTNVDHDKTGSS